MGILDEDVARVRAAADLVEIASEHLALKRVGRRFTGLCPFHAEKTPSFSINPELGFYFCFGCQAKGDVITFVREVEHLDFVAAVERLAGRYGIELRYDDVRAGVEQRRKTRLVEAMEAAVAWYHDRLLRAPDAARARGYLRSRGYDADAVRAFKLGWAPDDWDALARALSLPDDVLRDTGLGLVNRLGRQQDSFRARVMFPIFDASGKPVAFGGRVLEGGEGPKYKNSPETPIYSKSRVLYGLNWAKADIVQSGEVVVCEGYTDVIGFFRAGLPRAVATCGTALADEHFRLLKNFARRVVLAYDADAAGQAAAERFYAWERQYEIDIAVAALPPGTDPADLAGADPEGLRAAVSGARPFLGFRIDRALARAELRTPEGRARAAELALALIGEHPSDLVRDQYLMEVADRCRITPGRLRSLGSQPGRRRPVPVSAAGRPREAPPEGPEVEALRLAVQRPHDILDQLDDILFDDELNLAAYRALATSADFHTAVEEAGPAAGSVLQRVAVEEPRNEPVFVIAQLCERAARRVLTDIEAEVRRSGSAGDYAATVTWLMVTIEELHDPTTAPDAAKQLLAWLVQLGEEQG